MITRIARNDVVRLTRTGEVGTVDGWADHNKVGGTVIDVRLSTDNVVVTNAAALEFVADAKLNMSRTKAIWVVLAALLTLADGAWTTTYLHRDYGVPWYLGAILGVGVSMVAWKAVYLVLRPRKARLTQPARTVATGEQRARSRPVNR